MYHFSKDIQNMEVILFYLPVKPNASTEVTIKYSSILQSCLLFILPLCYNHF